MIYSDYEEGSLPSPIPLITPTTASAATVFHLPDHASFSPVRMEVYGPSDARDHMPARICLLGNTRATSRTFTLPREDKKAEGKGSGGGDGQ
jgi:hypothetical protein